MQLSQGLVGWPAFSCAYCASVESGNSHFQVHSPLPGILRERAKWSGASVTGRLNRHRKSPVMLSKVDISAVPEVDHSQTENPLHHAVEEAAFLP